MTRNYVLGLEAVLADGAVLRTGGRMHKNKTGFDLISLFVGSEGLLGVVTEITLRLLPFPPARATLSAAFATSVQAAEAVQAIFAAGFLPSSLEIADHFTLEAAGAISEKCLSPKVTRICSSISMAKGKVFVANPPLLANDREKKTKYRRDGNRRGGLRKTLGFAPSVQRFTARDRPDEAKRGCGRAAKSSRQSHGIRGDTTD